MFINHSKDTIFFLFENAFTSRDYKRFGIKNYEDNGWIVKILIFQPFLFKKISEKRDSNFINSNATNLWRSYFMDTCLHSTCRTKTR